eukprot:GHVN01019247.1.p1 GENE.GHVN01019247.1~~GHVN01019247.1.p1  ORF type:complete len:959 (-),score=151.24 GHVN01019247.1:1516-4392(-)
MSIPPNSQRAVMTSGVSERAKAPFWTTNANAKCVDHGNSRPPLCLAAATLSQQLITDGIRPRNPPSFFAHLLPLLEVEVPRMPCLRTRTVGVHGTPKTHSETTKTGCCGISHRAAPTASMSLSSSTSSAPSIRMPEGVSATNSLERAPSRKATARKPIQTNPVEGEDTQGVHLGCFPSSSKHPKIPKTCPQDYITVLQLRTELRSEEIQVLYSRFRKIAPRGYMSFSKFRDTMGMLGMLDDSLLSERMFMAMDVDNDGLLGFVEFASSIGVMTRGSDDDKLELAFRVLNPGYGAPPLGSDYEESSLGDEGGGAVDGGVGVTGDREVESWGKTPRVTPPIGDLGSTPATPTNKNATRLGSGIRLVPTHQTSKDKHSSHRSYHGRDQSTQRRLKGTTPDTINLEQFKDLAESLHRTKVQLVGASYATDMWMTDDKTLEELFYQIASPQRDCVYRITLDDFKMAVRTNTYFLMLLGVINDPQKHPFPAANHSLFLPAASTSSTSRYRLSSQTDQWPPPASPSSPHPTPPCLPDLRATSAKPVDGPAIESALAVTTAKIKAIRRKVQLLNGDTGSPSSSTTRRAQRTRRVNELVNELSSGGYRDRANDAQNEDDSLSSLTFTGTTNEAVGGVGMEADSLEALVDDLEGWVNGRLHQVVMGQGDETVSGRGSNRLVSGSGLQRNAALVPTERPQTASPSPHTRPIVKFAAAGGEGDREEDGPVDQTERESSTTDLPPTKGQYQESLGDRLSVHATELPDARGYFMNRGYRPATGRAKGSIAFMGIEQSKTKTKTRRVEKKLFEPTKGLAVYFGHESWNMVLNMMVGIRLAAGRVSLEPARRVDNYDFKLKEKFSIIPRASKGVSGESYEAVRFIDYSPMVFRKMREWFGVGHYDYLKSVGPEQLVGNMVLGNLSSLSELCSQGKSGAFFYYTSDGRFMIKTVRSVGRVGCVCAVIISRKVRDW